MRSTALVGYSPLQGGEDSDRVMIARGYLPFANIHHAHTLAIPKVDPFAAYIAFQQKCEEMMGLISERRDEVKKVVFG